MAEPTLEQLQTRLVRLASSAVPLAGVVYRSNTPQYATEPDLLTGAGSRRFGGRWNPVGLALVYTSLTPETAMAEALAHYRYYGISVADAMPRTFVAIEAKLQRVLDLRDGTVRQRLRVAADAITTVDWRAAMTAGQEPITHRLVQAAYAGDWEGLIVPSAADPTGHNLLVFPDKLARGSTLTIVNAGRLSPR